MGTGEGGFLATRSSRLFRGIFCRRARAIISRKFRTRRMTRCRNRRSSRRRNRRIRRSRLISRRSEEYRQGKWDDARRDFVRARDLGYKPGFLEGLSPSEYLSRMDEKQAEEARLAQRVKDNTGESASGSSSASDQTVSLGESTTSSPRRPPPVVLPVARWRRRSAGAAGAASDAAADESAEQGGVSGAGARGHGRQGGSRREAIRMR